MEKIRCNPPIIKVLTTIFQDAPNNRKGLPSGVLSRFDLGSIDWNGNRGEVVAALLSYAGLQWSASGDELWDSADSDPAHRLRWQPPVKPTSLQPAAERETTRGRLGAETAEHDSAGGNTTNFAARRAAEDAACFGLQPLKLVAPNAIDRLRRGTGWNNVPRPLTPCCVAD